MSAIYKIEQSRLRWKAKASLRGKDVRYLRKENIRIKKERNLYKREVRKLKSLLNAERMKNAQEQPVTVDKKQTIFITLQLFLSARISYNA